jgi:transposase
MKKKIRKKRVLFHARKRRRETRRRRVLALYRQGYSCNKIAVRLNANPHTVASDLHTMGKHVKIQKTKEKRNAALIKDRCEGKTISALAKKYRVSEDRVSEIISNYNKVAENPVPDFKVLRQIRLKKLEENPPKPKRKKIPPKPNISGSSEKAKTRREQYAELRLQRIVAMYNNGSTITMIAKQCNVTENRIYQLLNMAKMPIKKSAKKRPILRKRPSIKKRKKIILHKGTKSAKSTRRAKSLRSTKSAKSTKSVKRTKSAKT